MELRWQTNFLTQEVTPERLKEKQLKPAVDLFPKKMSSLPENVPWVFKSLPEGTDPKHSSRMEPLI
eukprot:2880695-Amphidinium_carterae.1